jgi:hypothetical protein
MDGILAPMLQITPDPNEFREESFVVLLLEPGSFEVLAMATTLELPELCGKSSIVLPLDIGSFEALTMASTPSPHQSLAFVVTGEVLANEDFYGIRYSMSTGRSTTQIRPSILKGGFVLSFYLI